MPELPDLKVFRNNLIKKVLNKKIVEAGTTSPKKLINSTPEKFEKLIKGKEIKEIKTRGKHLVFVLEDDTELILHLMLHGRIHVQDKKIIHNPTECFFFHFDNGEELVITDRTRWAKLEINKNGKSKLLSKLGPDADDITFEQLNKLLNKSRGGRIKPFLMDQKKMAGIGNAYADEILWASMIHPERTASKLSDKEAKNLHKNMKDILVWGVEESLEDVGDKLSESDRDWMKVYRKEGEPCPRCREKIVHMKVSSRDTFICPNCQEQ